MSAPTVNIPSYRSPDGDGTFLPGMDSNNDPAQLPPGKYARSMNTVNRGGQVRCRPGYRCLAALPPGNLQGGKVFRPKSGLPVVVFAVEGLLYVSEFPYQEYRQLDTVSFSPHARHLFFEQVEQSVVRNDDGSITHITPRTLLIIQDGGATPPAVFDGTRAEHFRGAGSIPLGGPMKWLGDRLWVARGAYVYASDLANPVSFVEAQYITSVEAFIFKGEVTALESTPGIDFPQLLVFTNSSTSRLLASIRQRSQWLSTPEFQKEIFPTIGCGANRSVTTHNGFLWWWSDYGLTSLDAASAAFITSALPYRDAEMADSKGRIAADVGGIACASVENYLLVSVPSADTYNTETWVLDCGAFQALQTAAPPVWNSFWSGTRPVEWLTEARTETGLTMFLSHDEDGTNRLWESFTADRLDESCPITWYLETRGYTSGDPLGLKQARFADIYLSELSGTVDVGIFWAGTSRGKYKRILTRRIEAGRGTINAERVITADELLYGLKNQSRRVRTEDARETADGETHASCEVESEFTEAIDESFQLLIVVSGPGAVRGVRLFTEPQPGDKLGGPVESVEAPFRAVRFDGASEHGPEVDVLAELSEDIGVFTSSQTTSVTVGEFTEIATGHAESVISQEDADKIALCIARRKASRALEQVLPVVVSVGEILV